MPTASDLVLLALSLPPPFVKAMGCGRPIPGPRREGATMRPMATPARATAMMDVGSTRPGVEARREGAEKRAWRGRVTGRGRREGVVPPSPRHSAPFKV